MVVYEDVDDPIGLAKSTIPDAAARTAVLNFLGVLDELW
jgi:hypothetical protein